MHTKYYFKLLCTLLVTFMILCECVCDKKKKWTSGGSNVKSFTNKRRSKNLTDAASYGSNRGFLPHVGLLSFGKVLNFFPVGGERECQPSKYTLARAGICLNPYDCRQRDGKAAGDCAQGLGVCCVFEVSCGAVVQNNLTYFMSPRFPELWPGGENCTITIEKAHAGITQLRIDFVHFSIAQPNRMTGECDEDVMVLGDGDNKVTLCGQNHGQHVYYTLDNTNEGLEGREFGDSSAGVTLKVHATRGDAARGWLLRLAQVPLAQSAPLNCKQYYTDNDGVIKTFNYASNGRYLANSEYRSCIRKNVGHCSIRYTPCNEKSFRIGTSDDQPLLYVASYGPGNYGGPGTGFFGPDGAFYPGIQPITPIIDQQTSDTQNDDIQNDVIAPLMDEDGSGEDPQLMNEIQPATTPPPPAKSFFSKIWSFIWPSWIWGQSSRTFGWTKWSPYAQHYAKHDDLFRYNGYGNFGMGLNGFGRQKCQDRITIPCENEYFMASSSAYAVGVCDPHHCGSSFCNDLPNNQCNVETSISPFAVSVHFGPPSYKKNPEDNLGVCLRYTQVACGS